MKGKAGGGKDDESRRVHVLVSKARLCVACCINLYGGYIMAGGGDCSQPTVSHYVCMSLEPL